MLGHLCALAHCVKCISYCRGTQNEGFLGVVLLKVDRVSCKATACLCQGDLETLVKSGGDKRQGHIHEPTLWLDPQRTTREVEFSWKTQLA